MTEANRPAFPSEHEFTVYLGLTKREYFAAMAMQGLCADPNLRGEKIVPIAIEMADKLIKQLNQQL